jgi:hypothetical protein
MPLSRYLHPLFFLKKDKGGTSNPTNRSQHHYQHPNTHIYRLYISLAVFLLWESRHPNHAPLLCLKGGLVAPKHPLPLCRPVPPMLYRELILPASLVFVNKGMTTSYTTREPVASKCLAATVYPCLKSEGCLNTRPRSSAVLL